ncbi:hypothetical protein LCGC14_1322810 [marine sediment metagenome]|uniref:Uncharacterized protein n=1 Tax=marine sediment metagenome TaxID=412755 RepID=A0A0F9L4G4_9ZZZZ
MTILLDSTFLYALKAKNDKYSERASEILLDVNKKELLLTNYLVLNETITLAVARSKANTSFMEKIFEIIWGQEKFFKIIQLTPHDFREVFEVLRKFSTPKKLLSFVDASLIFLNNKFNAKAILSFNSHFDGIISRIF